MSILALLTVVSGGGKFGGGIRSRPDCCCLPISVKMPGTSLLFYSLVGTTLTRRLDISGEK